MRSVYASLATILLAFSAVAQEDGDKRAADEDLESEDEETADIEEQSLRLRDRIRAVSNSTFLKQGRFELAPFGGISTSDAFFRRWTVGARASYFVIEGLSIGVGGGYNAFSQPLAPVVLLGQGAPAFVDPTPLVAYGDAGVTFSPLYGKIALMSEWIIHFDAFASGGIGVTVDDAVNPAVQLGGGFRIVLNRGIAFRTEIRDYLTTGDAGVENLLLLNFGLSVFFPLDFENTDRGTKKVDG